MRIEAKILEMRRLIESSAGKRLPGERDLAEKLAVSRPVVRSILAQLEAEGLVERRHGSGTYPVQFNQERMQRVLLVVDQEIKLGDDPFFTILIEQVQSSLQKHGIRSILERFSPGGPVPLLEQGVITFGTAGETILNNLQANSPPVVGMLLNKKLPANRRVSIFELADEKAGEEAVRHLYEAGFRELIFVGNLKVPSTGHRLDGIKNCVSTTGIKLEIIDCPQNYNGGLNVGKQLKFLTPDRQSGIIAANDWLALGLRAALAEKNESFAGSPIVSFDGLSLTENPSLNIRSLAVPFNNIAEDVVVELLRLDQSKTAVGRRIIYEFYWREQA